MKTGLTQAASMRPWCYASVLFTVLSLGPSHAAWADGMIVPQAGASVTFRSVDTYQPDSTSPTVVEQTVKRTVIASNGTEATYRLQLLTFKSSEPTSAQVSDEVSRVLDVHAFLLSASRIERKVQGSEQTVVATLRNDCQWDALNVFLPIGRSREVRFECTLRTNRNGTENPPTVSENVLTYEGRTEIETAAGHFSVQSLRLVSRAAGGLETTTHTLLDDRTGNVMRSEYQVRLKDGRLLQRAVSDVIAIDG